MLCLNKLNIILLKSNYNYNKQTGIKVLWIINFPKKKG
jgi:hypothetical protein